jgi:hypothetical protein
VYSSALRRSTSTACRWPNVPRRESWPVSRTGRPSISSEPNARISPVPQSIGPLVMAAARRCSCGSTFGWTVKPSGVLTWASEIRLRNSGGMAVASSTALFSG